MLKDWGPSGWRFLHSVGWAYAGGDGAREATDGERERMHRFLLEFARVLPCSLCSAHFLAHLRAHVPDAQCAVLRDRETLSWYLFTFHNEVNARLGKPLADWRAVRREYLGTSSDAAATAADDRMTAAADEATALVPSVLGAVLAASVAFALLRMIKCRADVRENL